jgi:uncharacterized membrane-anchored protein
MDQFSRRLRRWDLLRIAFVTLAAVWVIVVAAFVFAASSVQPSLSGIVAAAAALLIAATGFLYAWREPGR